MRAKRVLVVLAGLVAMALGAAPARAEGDPLWLLVSLKCLRHLAKAEAPLPCDGVDDSRGWDRGVALLKDEIGRVRMLAIPTHPVTGVEDPAALAPDEPNYFAAAWATRAGFPIRLHASVPPSAVAAVVDSRPARTHEQLHVIADCLDSEVAAALETAASGISAQWRPLPAPLKGRVYWARRVEAASAQDVQPLRLLAQEMPQAAQDMADWSVALAQPAALGSGAYLLLADKAEGGKGGRARDLLDHACAVATR